MHSFTLKATGLVRKNSLHFVEQVFSLYDAGHPLVLVADEAQAQALAGIAIDHCIVPLDRTGWFTAQHAIRNDDQIAQVTFTSGTEGRPKGIVLTHANLADATNRIIEQMQMTAEIREYVGVPATFSFGLGRYRAVSAVGGQAYMPPRGFDPAEFGRMLAAGQINALSVVPTLLRVLLAAPSVIGNAGKLLRWMEIGSQHMTPDEKQAVREMFPNARIVQHYGLTEASRSTFLTFDDMTAAHLASVGQPVGKTEVAVGPDDRILIRGPHVAKSRIDGDGLHDLLDADGWLHTNDLGHLVDGFVYFDGRADDVINCGGIKIAPDQLEARLLARLQPGAQLCVARVPDDERGDGVLVAVANGTARLDRVRTLADSTLREMGTAVGAALHVMAVDSIPRTETGKAQRKVLASQFEERQRNENAGPHEVSAKIGDVRALFEHEFPAAKVQPEDSFQSLGGDSLHFIRFSLHFERRFGALPDRWESQTIAELQRHITMTNKSKWLPLEAVTLTRSFFIICIVALHANTFVYSANWGAAYFLIILAGYSVARFQLPEIIRTGSVKTLFGTILSVALPTVMLIALLQIVTRKFEIMPLLLVSNFLDPRTLQGFPFYFAEFYLQLLVLAALLFSIPPVRAAFRDRPMVSALVLFVSVVAIDRTIEAIWNGDYNFHRTPWHYAWAFTLGVVIASANDLQTRLLALAVSLIAVLLEWHFTSAAFYVGGGCLLTLFVRSFIVPAPAKFLIAHIAGASLFIFLSHGVLIVMVSKLFGHDMPWLALFVCIVMGVALAQIYAWLERRFFQVRSLLPA
jgi:acyl-coenzyme A synthetase/AMP-(fatty) acid ligase/acyl carrier protein